MSEPKNSWHTKLAIGILLNDESELENKLDMLTAIGTSGTNEETFRICEELRDSLVSKEESERQSKVGFISKRVDLYEDENAARSTDDNRTEDEE